MMSHLKSYISLSLSLSLSLYTQCEEARPCFAGVLCTDLQEGYECGLCPEGYEGGSLRGYDIIDATTRKQVNLMQ